MKLIDDEGNIMPNDGKTQGRLLSRGYWVLKSYYNDNTQKDRFFDGGWFDTGDIATIDKNGFMTVTDRNKDIIKSGGEWISSIDLENICVGHTSVANAAAIAIPDEKWDERPIVVVVCHPNKKPEKQDILNFISQNVAKWQVPDDVIFMDEIPHTATGKISKVDLRQQLVNIKYVHPDTI